MAFASISTGDALEPGSSIFDVPELVGLVALYLSSHDITQCMATSKAWANLFEPFIWQHVVLNSSRPTPPTMARNRHRIRSLHVASNGHTNLSTLADDLPSIGSHTLDHHSGSSSSRSLATNPATTGNGLFQSLRTIRFRHDFQAIHIARTDELQCLDYFFRILNQSPGLLRVTLQDEIHNKSYSDMQPLLYILGHRLPCLKQLHWSGYVDLDTGLDLLQVCFNHPQLSNLNCGLNVDDDRYSSSQKSQRLDKVLTALEDYNRETEASGESAVGSRIKSLVLPVLDVGYPPNFICSLLRSHLPNLERFDVPEIYDEDVTTYKDSIKEAVAQGCPRLQHIKFEWSDYEEYKDDAVYGMIQGCKEMSLKTFHCESFTERFGIKRMMEILLEDHSTTLEEIDLSFCRWIDQNDLMGFFTMCKKLKKIVVGPSGFGNAIGRFQDMVLREWVCTDLRELRLTISRPMIRQEEDDSDEDSDPEGMDPNLVRAMARQVYGKIGNLSKLEILWLGCDDGEDSDTPEEEYEYDLTLERGWLGEFAGLRELKHFQMLTDFWSRMGQAEVEFIYAHWPKLEKITFGFYDSEYSEDMMEEPHWQWLKERRPHLKYGL